MKTFKDVQIGQTFCITRTGESCRKLSEIKAIGLRPSYCGFDFQDIMPPYEFNINEDERVYNIET